jgi:hypothetical protein
MRGPSGRGNPGSLLPAQSGAVAGWGRGGQKSLENFRGKPRFQVRFYKRTVFRNVKYLSAYADAREVGE